LFAGMIFSKKIRNIALILIAFGLFSSLPLVFGSATFATGSSAFLPRVSGPSTSTVGNYACTSSSPCPMGVTDYGSANGKTYSYTATEFVSWANFTALTIGGGKKMTIQQNLVDYNVAVEHNQGVYWIQNVPRISQTSSGYQISFEDNIWNFSAAYKTNPTMGPAGGNGNSYLTGALNGKCSGGVFKAAPVTYYACGTGTVATAKAPFEIKMVTSTLTISSGTRKGDSSVTFAAYVYAGGKLSAGYAYDQVAFTSKTSSSPAFKVGGSNPYGLYNDAELVLCGPGGGATVSITNISATLSEFYLSKGKLTAIPHAWSGGSDTAETVSGVHMTASSKIGDASHGSDNKVQLW
jgi:hypothetical protein